MIPWFQCHRRARAGIVLVWNWIPVVWWAAVGLPSTAAAQGRAVPATRTVIPAPALVLDHITVIDVEHGARLSNQQVVVVGNRIQALGSVRTVRVPAGARVVNARGKYLIPGLWDMHVHPARHGTAGTGPAMADAVYRQLLANGVTGIRDAGSPIALDTFRLWKREIATGRRIGPRLIVSGQSIFDTARGCTRATRLTCPNGQNGWAHATYVAGPTDARQLVDSFQAAGADMLKTYELSQPGCGAITPG